MLGQMCAALRYQVVDTVVVDTGTCRRPRPIFAVTTNETSIIIGKARNVGWRVAEPAQECHPLTPTVATDMTTGSRRIKQAGRFLTAAQLGRRGNKDVRSRARRP